MISSLLLSLSYNRKRFVLEVAEDRLYAMNTSKNSYFALFFMGAASLQVFSTLLPAFIKEPLDGELLIIAPIIVVISIIAFRQFLWLLRGTQELTIADGQLVLEKKGTFLLRRKVYDVKDISKLRMGFDETTLSWMEQQHLAMRQNRNVFVCHTQGQVAFKYRNTYVELFCDLDKNERLRLVEAMQAAIASQSKDQ